MRTKGTTVKSIQNFVKDKWPNKYNDWLENLPPESRKVLEGTILATQWYPLKEGAVLPTYHLKMFYDNNSLKAAWEAGRHSAESSLTGVYKIFVKLANPGYIIKRASKIMATYYENAILETGETTKNSVALNITKFEDLDKMIEHRIAGWIEKALELSGCKDIKIRITKSMTKGDAISEYKVSWK